MIDSKDYKKLQPYEPDLRRAYKADYKLPTPWSEDAVIEEILHLYEPGEAERINWNCGICSLRAYTRVGRLYFEYLEAHPEKNKENKTK